MGLWNGALVYVGARTLLAAIVILFLLRRQIGGPWFIAGQILSDFSCAAFLLAYVDADIRDDVGVLVVPLLGFVVYWEVNRVLALRRFRAETEGDEALLPSAWRAYGWVWTVGFVLPATLAAGFLLLEIAAPGQWPFPNPRPALACSPPRVAPGEALTLRMSVPHGGELSAFTPAGRALVIIPFAPNVPGKTPSFHHVDRLTLRTDTVVGRTHAWSAPQPVFADSGVYVLRVSEEAEIAPSRICRFRVTGAGPATGGTH